MMDKRIRVLIADDQPRARQSMKALLITSPQVEEVREAVNGREAIRLIEQSQPDLVLMDVRMPEMDGLEATRLIKGHWPEIRVIVLSLYPDYTADALTAGADAFVCKGESPEKLLAILSALASRDHKPVRKGK
jgi:DNA-binding NarL/FixJ family response regulator